MILRPPISTLFPYTNALPILSMLPAGNIPALLGLDYAVAGETISTVKNIPAFESIKYVSEPVVTIAVEPKHPKDRKSTRLNSSHSSISYAVFCLKKKKKKKKK